MKIRYHSLGVNEARLGLSLLIMLSVVFGYVALQRLGMTGDAPPPVEIRRQSPESTAEAVIPPPNDPAMRVLEPLSGEVLDVHRMSQRPEWDPPTGTDTRIEFDLNGRDSLWPGSTDEAGEIRREPKGPAR